jgi:hypothetical protein
MYTDKFNISLNRRKQAGNTIALGAVTTSEVNSLMERVKLSFIMAFIVI